MKISPTRVLFSQIAAFAFAVLLTTGLRLSAEEALFIGNSFTYGANVPAVQKQGGVPKLVELIAASKGRRLSSEMLTAGGKDWGYHLQQSATLAKLGSKKWNWVVLQDQSTKPTKAGNVAEFFQNGENFYKEIRKQSPQAKVLLYETWARGKNSPLYKGNPSGPSEVTKEIVESYTELAKRLEALEPGTQVALAPVGAAFERCGREYPEIPLYSPDDHHASAQGLYLSAMVIYAVLFQDSPVGVTREFPGVTIETEQASQLQKIAQETIASLHSGSK